MSSSGDARRQRREAALALRATMSPEAPAPDRFRVATWNLNSLRARLPAVERFLERAAPDVLLLQETVARHPIRDEQSSGAFGDEHLDREPRVASCVVDAPERSVRFVSVYVPHGRAVDHWHFEYKLAFLDALAARVRGWLHDGHVVVGGDVNVAATNSDVFHPDAFDGLTHVTPAERAALQRLLDTGLVDLDVARWGARARRFTWWNHGIGYSRNLGMRIDLLAADSGLASCLDTTWIDHVERGAQRPSDHAALIADLRWPD